MLAVAHVHELDGAVTAALAGVDGLVHIFYDKPATSNIISTMKSQNMFVVPTLALLASFVGEPLSQDIGLHAQTIRYLPSPLLSSLRSLNVTEEDATSLPAKMKYAFETVRALHQSGISILAGTDSSHYAVKNTAPGVGLHNELWLFVERCGLTPIDALRSATSAVADAFGLHDRGRIQPGMLADLLLVKGSPDVDIRSTMDIAGVWRRGERLDREAKRLRLEEVDLYAIHPSQLSTLYAATQVTDSDA